MTCYELSYEMVLTCAMQTSGTSALLEGGCVFSLLWLEYIDMKKAFLNCCEFIVVIRALILTSSSSYALKVGFISPDLRHLDLNLSPLTFILGNEKRLVTLGLVHVVGFKLLKVSFLLTELKVVQLHRTNSTLDWSTDSCCTSVPSGTSCPSAWSRQS